MALPQQDDYIEQIHRLEGRADGVCRGTSGLGRAGTAQGAPPQAGGAGVGVLQYTRRRTLERIVKT